LAAQLLLLLIVGRKHERSLPRADKGVDAMNQDQVRGKWNQLKGEIKKKWARMTDDDFLEVEGDMDKLSGRIQERTGDRKEDIRKWLNERSQ
jgi:uncharacterized protein YjbJ (UPF0337 family)